MLDQLLRVHTAEELDEAQHHMGALNVNSIEIFAMYVGFIVPLLIIDTKKY